MPHHYEILTCYHSTPQWTENNSPPLEWHLRLKIAIGTARGLRYLHEDCRVGCIVHKDMRPNNILLTHNYEPLVLLQIDFSKATTLNVLRELQNLIFFMS